MLEFTFNVSMRSLEFRAATVEWKWFFWDIFSAHTRRVNSGGYQMSQNVHAVFSVKKDTFLTKKFLQQQFTKAIGVLKDSSFAIRTFSTQFNIFFPIKYLWRVQ